MRKSDVIKQQMLHIEPVSNADPVDDLIKILENWNCRDAYFTFGLFELDVSNIPLGANMTGIFTQKISLFNILSKENKVLCPSMSNCCSNRLNFQVT